MQTIFRILMILLVASIVAGAFYLAVNYGSTAFGANSGGQTPAITDGQSTAHTMDRPEGGDRDGGSLPGGLTGVLATVMKLAGITVLVLALQKGVGQLRSRRILSA